MIDIERDIPLEETLKFEKYSINIRRTEKGLWTFLKGNRKEMPRALTGQFTNLEEAKAAFYNHCRTLVSYRKPSEPKEK